MITIPDTAFWIFNIVLVIMGLFCMAFSWEHGGKPTGIDILRIILQTSLTIALTCFLTAHYSLFDEESFSAYINGGSIQIHDPPEVNKFRFFRSGVLWFFISLFAVELIFGIMIHIYRKHHKADKKKPLTKRDHIIGEILGAALFLLWITLFSPVFISCEKAGFFTNGSDLINRTILRYPVNYAARPLTKLILGDNPAALVYDEGLSAITRGVRGFDQWIEEHCENVITVADLTRIFVTQEGISSNAH